MEMLEKVLEALTAKYSNIREGVKSAMGGTVLDYEAKRILNEGLAEGEVKGANIVCTLIQKLLADGRNEDIQKVLVDPILRGKLIQEYSIA